MKTRMLKNVGKIYSLALNVYIDFSHNIKIDVEYKKIQIIQTAEQILPWSIPSFKKMNSGKNDSFYNPSPQLFISKSFTIATTYNYIF